MNMKHEKLIVFILVSLILISGCISQPQEQESVTEYAEEKEISQEIIDSLEVLERDGKFDENERTFIDTIAGLSEPLQKAVIDSVILKDEMIDDQELEFLTEALSMNDLTLAVFESNIAQYTIDAELVERLKDIQALVETDKYWAKWTLENYYPKQESLVHPIENAMVIHENAWEMVVNNAKEDQYYKYGIYVSRTLAVKHPEVYLQADGLFVTIITANKGFKKVYEIKNVHDEDLYEQTFETPPFSFDYVDFPSYEIIESKEYYPEGYPVLSFLDRRLLPIASTLKSAENQLTQLEKGVQVYFANKKENKEMYLIYCDNENTYLSTGEDILSMKTLGSIEKLEGNPILIFNDQYVWYPLMERDDTDKNETLEELVTAYATEITTPSLNDFEQEMIEELKQVSVLSSDLEKDMAMIFSMRPVRPLSRYIKYVYYPDSYEIDYLDSYENVEKSGIDITGERRSFLKHGNYLSPITAYLAAIAEEYEGEEKLMELSREYLTYSATPHWFEAHGHTWLCMFVEQTVDESYATKTGHCIVQASNISAVLDLVNIDHYWIQGFAGGYGRPLGHDWLCLPEFDGIVSNGAYYIRGELRLNQIQFIGIEDKWAFIQGSSWVGTASSEEIIEMLKKLEGFYGEETPIYVGGLSLEDFIEMLEEEQ